MWTPRSRNQEEAVLETIAWFSLFSYPVTSLEVWRFLFSRAEYPSVEADLQRLVASGKLHFADGKYVLRGHESDIAEQESRYRYSLPKLRRARRAAAYLRMFSDVRAVFVCNTLSLMHAREESDIDLFVVAKSGSVWRVRFAAATPFAVLGMRPKGDDERDALCWSFFMSDASFDMRRFALVGEDPYLAFWGATLLPLYDPEGLLVRLQEASGLHTLFPQFSLAVPGPVGTSRGWLRLPKATEGLLRRIQMRKFPRAIREKIGQGTDVVVSDDALKFHTNDRRASYRDAFLTRLREIGLPV